MKTARLPITRPRALPERYTRGELYRFCALAFAAGAMLGAYLFGEVLLASVKKLNPPVPWIGIEHK